jgi:hypothetical protein
MGRKSLYPICLWIKCMYMSTMLILMQQDAAPDPWRHLCNICGVTRMMVTSTADRSFVCIVMVCCNFLFQEFLQTVVRCNPIRAVWRLWNGDAGNPQPSHSFRKQSFRKSNCTVQTDAPLHWKCTFPVSLLLLWYRAALWHFQIHVSINTAFKNPGPVTHLK